MLCFDPGHLLFCFSLVCTLRVISILFRLGLSQDPAVHGSLANSAGGLISPLPGANNASSTLPASPTPPVVLTYFALLKLADLRGNDLEARDEGRANEEEIRTALDNLGVCPENTHINSSLVVHDVVRFALHSV